MVWNLKFPLVNDYLKQFERSILLQATPQKEK